METLESPRHEGRHFGPGWEEPGVAVEGWQVQRMGGPLTSSEAVCLPK